jgi:putrescine transport system permease protein
MVSSPLVMPEVIIGLSLLLMLVSVQRMFGFPERGLATIWLGHTLLGMAYATVVVQSRLQELSPQLEEAAQDLGCKPLQVFFLVTLPLIAQAVGSAWLLTFTLSLDDVVLSAFLSGPGSTTMPIAIFSRARLGLQPQCEHGCYIDGGRGQFGRFGCQCVDGPGGKASPQEKWQPVTGMPERV